MSLIADALSATNILLALAILFYQVKFYRLHKQPWSWFKLAYSLIGAYWAGIYCWVLFMAPGSYDSVWFGQVFIRPAFTITLTVMFATTKLRGGA